MSLNFFRWCSWTPVSHNMLLCWQHWRSTITRRSLGLQQKKTIIGPKNKKRCLIYVHKTITLEDERINLIFSPTCDIGLLVFAFFSLTTMIIQIVSQSLVTHMKNSLILEELKWFNLVNGSGTFPTPAQVPFLSSCPSPISSHLNIPWSCLQVNTKKRYMKKAKERLLNETSLVVARSPWKNYSWNVHWILSRLCA